MYAFSASVERGARPAVTTECRSHGREKTSLGQPDIWKVPKCPPFMQTSIAFVMTLVGAVPAISASAQPATVADTQITAAVQALIGRHPELMVEPVPVTVQTVRQVGCHHEWYDGSGHPRGLQGEDIPLIAHIFTIADVFDALTSRRPYKSPFPLDKSVAIWNRAGNRTSIPRCLTSSWQWRPDSMPSSQIAKSADWKTRCTPSPGPTSRRRSWDRQDRRRPGEILRLESPPPSLTAAPPG